MRNIEDRVLAVKLRAKEIENQKRVNRRRVLVIGSFVASLMIITSLSFLMPGIMDSMPDDSFTNSSGAAGIFEGSSFFAFVLIGFLAFVLGISVTILAYKIKKLNQQDQEGNK